MRTEIEIGRGEKVRIGPATLKVKELREGSQTVVLAIDAPQSVKVESRHGREDRLAEIESWRRWAEGATP